MAQQLLDRRNPAPRVHQLRGVGVAQAMRRDFDARPFYSFTPRSTDILVAQVDFSADAVTSLAGQSGTVYSIPKGYASGNLTFKADWWNGVCQ